MSRRIYFDNAATTPLLDEVVEAMLPVLRDHYGNPSSIHAEGRRARTFVESARKTVAQALGASTAEVFFTSGGTESNNTAIKCAVRDLGVRRIISSPTEHHAVLHAIEAIAREYPIETHWLRVDAQGRPDLAQLEQLLAQSAPSRTLVSLMHANNEIGVVLDLATASALCAQYGALLHTDAVQTVGHFPLNVQQTPVSFLSGSAHKFHGPKGVGFLYINAQNFIRPFIDGGGQERNLRGGTENVAGIVGMAKALELAVRDIDARTAYIRQLRRHLIERLREAFDDLQFNGTPEEDNDLYTVLSVSFPPSPKNELLLLHLDIAGISASGGSACTSGAEQHSSHVLDAIGADPQRKTIRFSFSHLNQQEEVEEVVLKLREILTPAARGVFT
jgi:cysteine desulfurase